MLHLRTDETYNNKQVSMVFNSEKSPSAILPKIAKRY